MRSVNVTVRRKVSETYGVPAAVGVVARIGSSVTDFETSTGTVSE